MGRCGHQGWNEVGQIGDGSTPWALAPVQTLLGDNADLAIGLTSAGPPTVGSPFSYTITVSNAGTLASSGTITVTATLGPDL